MNIISGIKLVTFDATNTLIKFRMPPWHYYALVAKDYGFTGTEREVKEKFIDSYRCMWEKYPNFGKSSIPWDQWWRKVVERTFEGQIPQGKETVISKILIEEYKTSKLWCVAQGGRQLLNILEKKGINTGVVSNFDPRLHDILRSVGIIKQFKFIITSYEVGCSKPDKEIFSLAMKKCGLSEPSECLHIGDDVKKDYEAAISAGWRALVVPSGDAPLAMTEDSPAPEHVYPDLLTLANCIEKL
ncbi:rhythmically expressed gene 2 protein-like [Amyelois transitella]|uniref:rhythmically expressed gene 2 protein-like n=1 Tax=Amyelois transitella TaxID=680683 RepID=UPI00067B198F|nr:rhythmically expressed gene 2 protein-like [Amyelois transitella]